MIKLILEDFPLRPPAGIHFREQVIALLDGSEMIPGLQRRLFAASQRLQQFLGFLEIQVVLQEARFGVVAGTEG